MRQHSARWYVTQELRNWKRLVSIGEYDGPFFSFPDERHDVPRRRLSQQYQSFMGLTLEQVEVGCIYCGGGLVSVKCPDGRKGCIVHHGFICNVCGRHDPREFRFASNLMRTSLNPHDLQYAYESSMAGGDNPERKTE